MGLSHRVTQILENAVPLIKNTTDNIVVIDATVGGTVIVPANPKRVAIEIQNDGASNVLLAFGEDPSIDSYSKNLAQASGVRNGDGGEYNDNNPNFVWKGEIKGITEGGSTIVAVFEKIKVI